MDLLGGRISRHENTFRTKNPCDVDRSAIMGVGLEKWARPSTIAR